MFGWCHKHISLPITQLKRSDVLVLNARDTHTLLSHSNAECKRTRSIIWCVHPSIKIAKHFECAEIAYYIHITVKRKRKRVRVPTLYIVICFDLWLKTVEYFFSSSTSFVCLRYIVMMFLLNICTDFNRMLTEING